MEDHRVKRLPVIENHRLVGIITEADLARNLNEHRLAEFVEKVYTTASPAAMASVPRISGRWKISGRAFAARARLPSRRRPVRGGEPGGRPPAHLAARSDTQAPLMRQPARP
jgi:CBS domain-containing protein